MENHDYILHSVAGPDDIICYTDASVKNSQNGGVAACIVFPDVILWCGQYVENYCVDSCELYAILVCLEQIFLNLSKNIFLFSDSQIALDMFRFIFDTNIVRNQPPRALSTIPWMLIDYLRFIVNSISRNHMTIHLNWIPAHSGILGNERVDELAKFIRVQ